MPGVAAQNPAPQEAAPQVDDNQIFGSSSGHVLRNEHNIVETGMTSVKVHQMPGGNSSINIFGDTGYGQGRNEVPEKPVKFVPQEDTSSQMAGVRSAPANTENLIYMNVEETKHASPSKQQHVTDKQLYGGAPAADQQMPEVFGARSSKQRTEFNMGEGAGSLTSVKVHHAPGGASNFSLGDDTSAQAIKPKNQTPFYNDAPAHDY